MRFVTPAILKGKTTFSLRLTLRPDSGNGIVIYAEKFGRKKFFGLALKDTYLELRYCNYERYNLHYRQYHRQFYSQIFSLPIRLKAPCIVMFFYNCLIHLLNSFNMGSGPEKLQSNLPLTLDTWHGIEVIFSKDKVGFSVNENVPIFEQSNGPLDIDNIFYVGGVANASDATPK
jgi:hypothetical protein